MSKKFPLEQIYQFGDKLNKIIKKPKRINDIPVISIGNLTTGGTGKTPAAVYIVKLLQKMNYKPGILTRGYGGTIYKDGGILSDGKELFFSERESGDEPYLLSVNLPGTPIAVGKDRYLNGQKMEHLYDVNVFVLDDGFQHYSLQRDLDIVLIDATNPFGNGHLLPHGSLREPVEALKRSDVIILTKTSLLAEDKLSELKKRVQEIAGHSMIFLSNHTPSHLVQLPAPYGLSFVSDWKKEKLSIIKNKSIWALSGIGNHRAFEKTLLSLGASEILNISYRDHYRYTLKDVLSILKRVAKDDYLVTTEKDWIRMQYFKDQFSLLNHFYFLSIQFSITEQESRFIDKISSVF
ncbi:MAG: tetraacyldisaccharide 4'-kinase [Spirochaetia bacterium]|nr:tetraacyldisaccharide 4'-kinase [Spirochaetia bacterium]